MTARIVETDEGSRRCGAVRFRIETDFPGLTTCDCSICRRKNARLVEVHGSRFRLMVRFDSQELWPDSSDAAFVRVGVFESDLERAGPR